MKKILLILLLVVFIFGFSAPTLLAKEEVSTPEKVTLIGGVYLSPVLPGSWKYYVKIWRDKLIDYLLIYDENKRYPFEVQLAHKRLLEAQELAEMGQCMKITLLVSKYQQWMDSVLNHLITAGEEKDWERGRFIIEFYRYLPQQKQALERIEFFCPEERLDGKNLKTVFNDTKKRAESYWGLGQLQQFHQERIEQ